MPGYVSTLSSIPPHGDEIGVSAPMLDQISGRSGGAGLQAAMGASSSARLAGPAPRSSCYGTRIADVGLDTVGFGSRCWPAERCSAYSAAMALISYSHRLTKLAEADPDRPAISCGEDTLTRIELDSSANRLARDLAAGGVGVGDMVTIALPNSVDWSLRVRLVGRSAPYRSRSRRSCQSTSSGRSWPWRIQQWWWITPTLADGRRCLPVGYLPDPSLSDDPLPNVTSPAWKAPTSGGSTGRPS